MFSFIYVDLGAELYNDTSYSIFGHANLFLGLLY